MEKYGFVYIWRDRKHNRYYIGSHWGTEDDGYVCSSPWMTQAYKRRPDDFRRKILGKVYSTRKDLLELEESFLSRIKEEEIGKRYYNLCRGGTGHWSAYPEKAKTLREKISHKTTQAMWRDDVRDKYLKGLENRDNRSSDPEVRKKRSKSAKQTLAKLTDEQRKEKTTEARDAILGSKILYKEGKMKKAKPGTEKWNLLISSGWSTTRDKVYKHKKLCCPHCNKTGGAANMTRFHFNNCKNA